MFSKDRLPHFLILYYFLDSKFLYTQFITIIFEQSNFNFQSFLQKTSSICLLADKNPKNTR